MANWNWVSSATIRTTIICCPKSSTPTGWRSLFRHSIASPSAQEVSITELDMETFIAHNVLSPNREAVLREFQRHKVPLNMDVEMPTVETIRRLVQHNEGVAFLPRMCVEQEIQQDLLREIRVKELSIERKIRLVYPARRALSHAAKAFLEVVKKSSAETESIPESA